MNNFNLIKTNFVFGLCTFVNDQHKFSLIKIECIGGRYTMGAMADGIEF